MEKRIAHYPLKAVQATVATIGIRAFTRTALHGVELLGLTEAQALAVVLGLDRGMLVKSMTTYADHRVWQDVYHAPCPNGRTAYIKLTLRAEALVIQFKEL